MGTFTTKDGTEIYYKDWGKGPIITFSHGWPLSSDSWEAQMFYFASHGYRAIAHDRRGHGRSAQPSDGNDMDTYADDLAQLLDHLDVRDATMVGFSTGGGEVARYIGRHGTRRLKKAVLVSAIPPLMLKTENNPLGTPIEAFDGLRKAFLENRSKFFRDIPSGPFYGFNKPGAQPDQGLIDFWWLQGMQCGYKATYECIKVFSETDLTEDLKKFDIPTLIVHGDADQVVPIVASARQGTKLIKDNKLLVYEGAPHGLTDTHRDRLNNDLLAFIRS
ncbi:alpha/beta fold hydrolase [Frateuria soli]|uniref:alpha/beta fold hydrolase n=1 Tax=Frateuria soli TaxID=1542730 RepID=UPI001E459665|nr:alpha/beta hydrolase [Frateuria soli]UGB39812.1 alpha/beta hydrolase [Frateuria soli]